MTTQQKEQTGKTTSSKTTKGSSEKSTSGKQGFASMPKEKVQEIAAEGGRHSHDNDKDHNK